MRELENILERALRARAGGRDQRRGPAARRRRRAPSGRRRRTPEWPLQEHLDAIERKAILDALEQTHYNRTAAAKLLGITFRALRYRMERLGIKDELDAKKLITAPGVRRTASRHGTRRRRCGSTRPGRALAVAFAELRRAAAGREIELLVIHAISLPPGEFGGADIVRLFTNRLDPAAHPYYAGICGPSGFRAFPHPARRRAHPVRAVRERAWHAGESSWRGRARCNDFSIGVELEGADDVPFDDAQYATLAALTRALRGRYPIADIAGHSDIAPGRKTDPGPAFRLAALARSSATRDAAERRARRELHPSRALAGAQMTNT